MGRTLPNWVRCFEDIICVNCIYFMEHPDPSETREGFCKRKCDSEIEVRWDNWCGEGIWIHNGSQIDTESAPLHLKYRDEVNKDKKVK